MKDVVFAFSYLGTSTSYSLSSFPIKWTLMIYVSIYITDKRQSNIAVENHLLSKGKSCADGAWDRYGCHSSIEMAHPSLTIEIAQNSKLMACENTSRSYVFCWGVV